MNIYIFFGPMICLVRLTICIYIYALYEYIHFFCPMICLVRLRMLRAILNKSWQQHRTRHQLYGHLPPITKTIQVRRTRHAGHCWRSRDEHIRDVLLWIPTTRPRKSRTTSTNVHLAAM